MVAINFNHVTYGNTDKYCISYFQLALQNKGYNIAVDGNYGPSTKSITAAFQRAQGWSGSGADGLPGPRTFALLGLTHTDDAGGSTNTQPGTTAKSPTAGAISTSQVDYSGKGSWSSGSAACKGYITQALNIIGLPVTDAWINGMLTIALRESAYNAAQWQVNTTDSNAIGAKVADGYPYQCSRGGWQCIPQTFAAYKAAGASNKIYDPVANVSASINYVRKVYGVANDGSNLASKVQQADPNRSPRGY